MGSPSRCWVARSEEHTSELQSRSDLVCRLLLEKNARVRSSARPRGRRSSWATRPPGRPPGGVEDRGRVELEGVEAGSELEEVFFFCKVRNPPEFPPFPHPALFGF